LKSAINNYYPVTFPNSISPPVEKCQQHKHWAIAKRWKKPKKPPFERGCRPQTAGVCVPRADIKVRKPPALRGHPLSKGGGGGSETLMFDCNFSAKLLTLLLGEVPRRWWGGFRADPIVSESASMRKELYNNEVKTWAT